MLMKILYVVMLIIQTTLPTFTGAISYRLPQEVKPLRYYIEMRPDFENNIFTGDVTIEVEALKTANSITLNQHKLLMPLKERVTVIDIKSKSQLQITSVGQGESIDQQFFVISLSNFLTVGKQYLIKLQNFSAEFKTYPTTGFYYAKYYDEHGNLKTFATTDFEAVDARRAFPCFDEPALKARFNLVIRRASSKYISVSNTPRNEGLSCDLIDVFEETNLMSTYLVAFIVSEMKISETLERHRVLAPEYDINTGRYKYSLNSSFHVLKEMERFIRIPYTLKKLDHASIPKDYFSAGAMENWGLITYSDGNLLLPPNPSIAKKKEVLSTISHEIGHQWFGNLVSPQWWEYIWLNEGFGNYFQYYLAHKVQPNLDLWREMAVVSTRGVMEIDGIPNNTRPMNQPVERPEDIISLFDDVAYQKSGAVIKMLECVVSTPVFAQGLNYYIKDRQFKAATPSDLYSNIQKALDASALQVLPKHSTVANFMVTWDSARGFPLVTVTRNYDNSSKNVHLMQAVFNNFNNQGEDGKWDVPINYATASTPLFEDTLPQTWLRHAQDTITISNLQVDDWLIVNKQQTGYYRVNYDETNWNLISDVLRSDHHQIDPLNRAQLIDDCHYLANSGTVSQRICNHLEEYVVNEDDPIVLRALIRRLFSLDNQMYYTNIRNKFQYSLDKVSPSLLRNVFKVMCTNSKIGLEAVLDFIIKNFLKIQQMSGLQIKPIIEELARSLYSFRHLIKLKTLQSWTNGTRVLEKVIAVVSENVDWFYRNKQRIQGSFS